MDRTHMANSDSSAESDAEQSEVALITGANKGIGYETARQLGERGMTVFVSARNEQRGEEATETLREDGIDTRFVRLDVTDEATIEAAVRSIDDEFGRLDVLVNNAGVSLGGNSNEGERPPSEVTAGMMRRTYEVNVFGVVAVTHAMLPLLRRAPAGRIVNVSSELGSMALLASSKNRFNELAYNSSKAAVNAMTLVYAAELRDAVLVNAAAPGYTSTALHDFSGGRPVEEGASFVVRAATLPADGPSGQFIGPSEYFEEDHGLQW